MTIELDERVDDQELERRLRMTLRAVMPLLDRQPAQFTGASLEPDQILLEVDRYRRSPHRARFAAVALSLVATVVVLFVLVTRREPVESPVGDDASITSSSPMTGQWYDTIRPFLPDGFDQIALMHAGDDAVVFRSWRTGTGQILDLTIGLQSGVVKATTDSVTDVNASGTWFESTSDVTLITNDGRLISLSCGVQIDTGGLIGIFGSSRDYCGDEFDHAGIGPMDRRAIVTALATRFPTATPDAAFGIPALPTADLDHTAAVITEVLPDVDGTVVGGQWDGVVQYINLTGRRGPGKSELSIVHGITPPRAADANPAFAPLPATDPSSRMMLYDDIAIGWMVNDDGIGYHIATTDISPENLARLGTLLERLSQVQANEGPIARDVATPPSSASATESTMEFVDGADSERFAPLPEGLARLGFTLHTLNTDQATGVTTALDIRDDAGGRTGALTVTPGTPLVPENHNRSPLRILEQTDVLLHGEIAANSGWRFEVTFTRTTTGRQLPTIAEVEELLYSIDP